jgi:hypothetical protein
MTAAQCLRLESRIMVVSNDNCLAIPHFFGTCAQPIPVVVCLSGFSQWDGYGAVDAQSGDKSVDVRR